MEETIEWFLGWGDFPARWYCGNWSDALGWLHILSSEVTFACYMVIPWLALRVARRAAKGGDPMVLVGSASGVLAAKWLAAFVLVCGLNHGVEPLIFWVPIYRPQALLKFAMAAVSVGACGAFWELGEKWN